MPFNIIITSNALRDIQEAIHWENNMHAGLGKRFYKQLEQRLLLLSFTPFAGSIRYENVRCTTTKVFKYIIHYIVNQSENQIIVLRVLHVSRKPIY